MNLANQPVRAITKADQLRNDRIKPLARTRGAISNNVRKQLSYRSQGYCERCGRKESYSVRLEAAHTTRRWKIEGRTTVNQLSHLCTTCHRWADSCKDGRDWLAAFETKLMERGAG